LIPALTGAVFVGVGLSWLLVGYVTLLQRRTPAQLQGRVFSAAEALLAAPQTLSIGLGAALVTFLGFRVIYGVNGAVLLLCGWLLYRSPVRGGERGEDFVADVPPSPTAEVPPSAATAAQNSPLEPVALGGGAYDNATSSSRSSPQ
jgi:hypothetical protein